MILRLWGRWLRWRVLRRQKLQAQIESQLVGILALVLDMPYGQAEALWKQAPPYIRARVVHELSRHW